MIAPYYIKGTVSSVLDLNFFVTKDLIADGRYLYRRYKDILIEAQGYLLSGQVYQSSDREERILINHAVGLMKLELNKG